MGREGKGRGHQVQVQSSSSGSWSWWDCEGRRKCWRGFQMDGLIWFGQITIKGIKALYWCLCLLFDLIGLGLGYILAGFGTA